MSGIGTLAVLGLVLIVLVLMVWIGMTIRAAREPSLSKERGEPAKRGEVSGGVIEGSPAQLNRRDEAPRAD